VILDVAARATLFFFSQSNQAAAMQQSAAMQQEKRVLGQIQVLHSEIALLRSELAQEKERVSEKSRQNLRLQQLYNQTRRAFLDVPQLQHNQATVSKKTVLAGDVG